VVLFQSQFQPNILTAELLENLKDEKYLFHKDGHFWNSHITWAQDSNIPIPLLLQDRFPSNTKLQHPLQPTQKLQHPLQPTQTPENRDGEFI
jgi:hypothetical protein